MRVTAEEIMAGMEVVSEEMKGKDNEKELLTIAEDIADDYFSRAEIHPRHDEGLIVPEQLWSEHRKLFDDPDSFAGRFQAFIE